MLLDANRRYNGTLAEKAIINKTSRFGTKYISPNQNCVYTKINSNIKTTFDIFFRKKVYSYAIETYNEALFQSCFEGHKFTEASKFNPNEVEVYYRITSGIKTLR